MIYQELISEFKTNPLRRLRFTILDGANARHLDGYAVSLLTVRIHDQWLIF
jgi:hypothetical protein